MNSFAKGVVLTLAGAVLWGFSGGCAQHLLSNYDTSPMFLTTVRMPVAGLLFLAWSAWRHPGKALMCLRQPSNAGKIALFGCAGLFLSQVTYLICIDFTNAGTATVLQQTCCVLTMLWTCITTRRAPRPAQLAALACAMAATSLIATGGNPSTLHLPLAGVAWGLLSALTVAFYLVQPLPLMREWRSMLVTGLGMLAGGIFALVTFGGLTLLGPSLGASSAWTAIPELDATGWLMLAAFVVLGTFAAYALFLTGVSIVGSVAGGMLGCAEPVSASLFAFLWLGTPYIWADWAGMALMLATIVLITLGSAPKAER